MNKNIITVTILTLLILLSPLQADRGLQLKKMQEEQRVALIIGNNSYKNLSKLKNPVNDARAMKAELKKRGFVVIYKENASKRDMKKLVKKFAYKLKSGGVGLYYFAGHGINVDGQNYLVGTDSLMEDKEEVEFETLALNYVTKKMKEASNRLNIVILDACRNDPFSRSGGGGLAPISNAKGLFVAYATEAGSVASDGKSGKNGVFTKYLVKNMQERGASIESVFKNTRADVYEATNGKQSPGVYSQIRGNFFFTLPSLKNYKPSSTKVQLNKSTNFSNKTLTSGEKEFWQEVESEGTKEYYTMYLEEYPNGYYEEQANAAMAAEELNAWNKVKSSTYGSDFNNFLKKYPNSGHARLAKLKAKKYKNKHRLTTLIWQDNKDIITIKKDWDGAMSYCRELTLDGYSDWFLPSKDELKSIADSIKNPTKNDYENAYWSSTTYKGYNGAAWYVNMSIGVMLKTLKSDNRYVRCVRGGQ